MAVTETTTPPGETDAARSLPRSGDDRPARDASVPDRARTAISALVRVKGTSRPAARSGRAARRTSCAACRPPPGALCRRDRRAYLARDRHFPRGGPRSTSPVMPGCRSPGAVGPRPRSFRRHRSDPAHRQLVARPAAGGRRRRRSRGPPIAERGPSPGGRACWTPRCGRCAWWPGCRSARPGRSWRVLAPWWWGRSRRSPSGAPMSACSPWRRRPTSAGPAWSKPWPPPSLAPRPLATLRPAAGDSALHLIELDGFVAPAPTRRSPAPWPMPDRWSCAAYALGGYARPPRHGRLTRGPLRRAAIEVSVMTSPRPRPGILEIVPYVGGKARHREHQAGRLSSNESPLGPSPAGGGLSRAPPRSCTATRTAPPPPCARCLGRHRSTPIGSSAAPARRADRPALRAYAGPPDEVLYTRHGFLIYPIAAMAAGAPPLPGPRPT